VLVAAGLLGNLSVQHVLAHQNPSGCNSNRLNTSIIKDPPEVYQGQTLTYSVTVSNLSDGPNIACEITNASIDVRLPAMDGSPTGATVNMGTGLTFASGMTITLVGSTPYVVNVNPGVTDIVAEATASGTLHDAPVDHSALIVKTVGTSVITPPAAVTAAAAGGQGATTAASVPRLPNTGTAPRR
jgi:hypothetical protein